MFPQRAHFSIPLIPAASGHLGLGTFPLPLAKTLVSSVCTQPSSLDKFAIRPRGDEAGREKLLTEPASIIYLTAPPSPPQQLDVTLPLSPAVKSDQI